MQTPAPPDDLRIGMYVSPILRYENTSTSSMFYSEDKKKKYEWVACDSGRIYQIMAIDLPLLITLDHNNERAVFDVRMLQFKVLTKKYVQCFLAVSKGKKPSPKSTSMLDMMINPITYGGTK